MRLAEKKEWAELRRWAPAEGDHGYLRREIPKDFPIVAFNRLLDVPGCGAVLTENERGARYRLHLRTRKVKPE